MTADPDSIEQLREAVRLSPKNLPLRQALADALLNHSRPAEAETEFRAALALAPDNAGLKLGLARAFSAQAKLEASQSYDGASGTFDLGLALTLAATLQF